MAPIVPLHHASIVPDETPTIKESSRVLGLRWRSLDVSQIAIRVGCLVEENASKGLATQCDERYIIRALACGDDRQDAGHIVTGLRGQVWEQFIKG